MTQDVEDAKKALTEKVKEAEKVLQEAIDIAEKFGIPFDWDIAYGMGGTYVPSTIDPDDNWYSSDDTGGWVSSTSQC